MFVVLSLSTVLIFSIVTVAADTKAEFDPKTTEFDPPEDPSTEDEDVEVKIIRIPYIVPVKVPVFIPLDEKHSQRDYYEGEQPYNVDADFEREQKEQKLNKSTKRQRMSSYFQFK